MTSNTLNSEKSAAVQPKTTRDNLRLISLILAVIGIGVSGYLAYTKISGAEIACIEGVTNCEVVNNSIYAFIGGIYVGYIGLAGYLAILLALLLEDRISLLRQWGRLALAGITFFGFLFSGYLTSIEAFVLREWCQWCVISAIVMTALFALSLARLWRADSTDEA